MHKKSVRSCCHIFLTFSLPSPSWHLKLFGHALVTITVYLVFLLWNLFMRFNCPNYEVFVFFGRPKTSACFRAKARLMRGNSLYDNKLSWENWCYRKTRKMFNVGQCSFRLERSLFQTTMFVCVWAKNPLVPGPLGDTKIACWKYSHYTPGL